MKDLKRSVTEKGVYNFSYWEYLLYKFGRLLFCICCCRCMCCRCCFRRSEKGILFSKNVSKHKYNFCRTLSTRFERHKKAMEMFDEEFDVINIIHVMRLSEFFSHFLLKKHQRALMANFQKHQISDLGWNRFLKKAKPNVPSRGSEIVSDRILLQDNI